MRLSWKRLAPPHAAWLAGEGAAIAVTLALVLSTVLGSSDSSAGPGPGALPPAPPSPFAPLPDELRAGLLEFFGGAPLDPEAQNELFAEVSSRLAELGLSLESRQVEAAPIPAFPSRRRTHLAVRGPPDAEIAFLRFLTEHTAPIAITRLEWKAGGGPEERILSLTLEVFVASPREAEATSP